MVLGDNIFYGNGFGSLLRGAVKNAENGRATVFGYYVNDPERFGIAEFDEDGKVLSVEEKPAHPKSNYAITGLYFLRSAGGRAGQSRCAPPPAASWRSPPSTSSTSRTAPSTCSGWGSGFAWLDTGTMDSLVDAADFVRMIEKRQSIKISAPEEIAYKNGWITREKLLESAQRYGKSPYGEHLKRVADG